MTRRFVKLSPSKLNLFQDCPFCFWLQEKRGIRRPQGPFSSLPSGMDNLIKDYFDKWRRLGKTPPEVKDKMAGSPMPDQRLLDKWRYWQTGLKHIDEKGEFILRGALDECFKDDDYYIPVDYKTRGYDLKKDTLDFYQLQLDSYTLMLESEGYKTKNLAYLVYYIPREVKKEGEAIFSVDAHKIKTDPQKARKVAKKAAEVIRSNTPPPRNTACEFCSFREEAF